MNRTVSRKILLYIVLIGIFISVLILNLLNYPYIGDDYVYAFMWQGKVLITPLPENARRIQSFSDIFQSLYSHYFTWGGRMVAHFFVMFFMWVGKFWFDITDSLIVVLLLLEMQWIAHEGRITMDIKAGHVALAFFCLWAFHFDWGRTILWLAGACNYLWALVMLLLFLLPYIRHYFTNGEMKYNSWMTLTVFVLGLVAGDTNENTICWIGLSGIFYLWYCYRKKTLNTWMIAGFIGLSLGYALLIFAPGNWIRRQHDLTTGIVEFTAYVGFSFFIQLFLWIYLFVAHEWFKRNSNACPSINKYFYLSNWFAGMGVLFNLIMLASPAFYPRSTFPNSVFVIIAVVLIVRMTSLYRVCIVGKKMVKSMCAAAILYYGFTYGVTTCFYVDVYRYFNSLIYEAVSLQGTGQGVVVHDRPKHSDWMYISGFHITYNEFLPDDDDWRNVSFARYYRIKKVHVEY